MNTLFLGGTCGSNKWREERAIPALIERGVPPLALFNPVVSHWDSAAQAREDEAKQTSLMLYVIASPDPASGTANVSGYSIVEAVMGLYDAPTRTVVVFDTTGMPKHTAKAMSKAYADLRGRFPDAPIFIDDYEAAIDWLVDAMSTEAQ